MLISNYGLFWKSKYVHFGSNNNLGTLSGYLSTRKSSQVNFREQIGVYALYDKDLVPIYIGQAGNGNATLYSRLHTHTKDYLKNRWEYFSWFGLKAVGKKNILKKYNAKKKFTVDGSNALNELEGILIATVEPKLNKQGPKIKKSAKEYHQYIEKKDLAPSIKDVMKSIAGIKKELQNQQKIISKLRK